MRTIVYYDVERIDAGVVARAERLAPGAVHVRVADCPWPVGMPVTAQTIPPARDAVVRAAALDAIDRCRKITGECRWGSAELWEIARFELMGLVLADFHRAWVIERLLAEQPIERLIWVSGDTAPWKALREDCRQAGIAFVPLGTGRRWRQRLESIVARSRKLLWQWRESAATQRAARQRRKQSASRGHKVGRTVFAEYYPNSAKMALRLANRLEELRPDTTLLLAGRRDLVPLLESGGKSCKLINEFAGGSSDKLGRSSALKRIVARAKQAIGSAAPTTFAMSGKFGGQALLGSAFARAVEEAFPIAAGWVDQMANMVEGTRPTAVVTTTYSSYFGRALAAAAAAAGVPSVYVQHGLFPADAFWVGFLNTHVLVWGDANRRAFIAAGLAPEAVHVVGAPTLDAIASLRAAAHNNERSVRPTTQWLFLASRTGGVCVNDDVARRTLEAVVDAVRALPNAELVVKLHPGDHTGLLPRLLAGVARVRIEQQRSSLEVISQSDAVIVTSSTTGLEACALDKPMIVFNLTGTDDAVDYAAYGAAVCLTQSELLADAVKRLLKDHELGESLRAGRMRLVDDMLAGATAFATDTAACVIASAAGLNSTGLQRVPMAQNSTV